MEENPSNIEETVSTEIAAKLKTWNTVCPVMGNEVDLEANKVKYEGKLYGFCCNGCDKKFAANPEKYSKNLSADRKIFIKQQN